MPNHYDQGLDRNPANFAPLTPLGFIERAAFTHPRRAAIIHGDVRHDWAAVYARTQRLASALARRGIGAGDTVAVMSPNVPALYEAHFGVPMAGAVLNALNYRLDAASIAFILEHSGAKVLLTDSELAPTIKAALDRLKVRPLVVDILDPLADSGERLGDLDYETFLAEGDPEFAWRPPDDEWNAIALNYTSGTTGNPKGVVYHHRGAYLNAIANVLAWQMPRHPVYLWTLPMFHCNGWCFPWTIAAQAGTNVCLRRVDAAAIYNAFADHGVTHLCGAPIVMQMITGAPAGTRRSFDQPVAMMTAAAPPPAAVLADMARLGIDVTHVYGLTEVYGPAVVCDWHPEWRAREIEHQAALKSRQGVRYPVLEGLMVADPESLAPVRRDGETLGEVFMRGNIVMKGYLRNNQATEAAFAGGWFHTGDLGVWHADGYIELKDRAKDIIISGGENISSIEVEDALYRHPAVAVAAVVAKPDPKWGETPCAFVELKPDMQATEDELVTHCRDLIAHYKCPRTIVFGALPRTPTGKIQKFILREHARTLAANS